MYKYYPKNEIVVISVSSLVSLKVIPVNPIQASQPSRFKSSRILSKVLSTAIRLWLRSQVEQVEALQVKIEGSDRLLLSGQVPKVSVAAARAVYQGLYLGQISLVAKEIQINLSQVLKGQPLRLLEPVPVEGELHLQQADLNHSLQVPLLANGLTEFWLILLKAAGLTKPADGFKNQPILWQQIALDTERITINGVCLDAMGNQTPVAIRAGVQIENGRQLRFYRVEIESHEGLPTIDLESLDLDLGSEVDIEELTLSPGQIVCCGRLLVRP